MHDVPAHICSGRHSLSSWQPGSHFRSTLIHPGAGQKVCGRQSSLVVHPVSQVPGGPKKPTAQTSPCLHSALDLHPARQLQPRKHPQAKPAGQLSLSGSQDEGRSGETEKDEHPASAIVASATSTRQRCMLNERSKPCARTLRGPTSSSRERFRDEPRKVLRDW